MSRKILVVRLYDYQVRYLQKAVVESIIRERYKGEM